jgi:hypothetical protein
MAAPAIVPHESVEQDQRIHCTFGAGRMPALRMDTWIAAVVLPHFCHSSQSAPRTDRAKKKTQPRERIPFPRLFFAAEAPYTVSMTIKEIRSQKNSHPRETLSQPKQPT